MPSYVKGGLANMTATSVLIVLGLGEATSLLKHILKLGVGGTPIMGLEAGRHRRVFGDPTITTRCLGDGGGRNR